MEKRAHCPIINTMSSDQGVYYMSVQEAEFVDVDFFQSGNRPTLELCTSYRKGIEALVRTVEMLAAGRSSRVALHTLNFVRMKFNGEVWLETLKARRLADNLDVIAEQEGDKTRVIWRASEDEWHDAVDLLNPLGRLPHDSCQYFSLPSCMVEVVVRYRAHWGKNGIAS